VTMNITHDGRGNVYKIDHSGLSRKLELDDREVQLFQTLIPTGYWLVPSLLEKCGIQARSIGSYKAENTEKEIERVELQFGPDGETKARMHIDKESGLPIRGVIRAFGTSEIWEFSEYSDITELKMKLSTTYTLANTMGEAEIKITAANSKAIGESVFKYPPQDTSSATPNTPALSSLVRFTPAEPSLTPLDTTFEGEGGPISVSVTYGGHMLVPVQIGGVDAGMFLLDTGCGGLVLNQKTASLLGLSQFGEVYASVIGGTLKTSMALAKDMQVGPMTVKKPLFAVTDLRGLLENYDVAGILGYDFFRRAVVSGEIPEIFGDDPKMALWDPAQYYPITPPNEEPMEFQPLQFLEDTPYVKANLWSADDSLRERVSQQLLMLDVGAGDSSCIITDTTVRNLNLGSSLEAGAGVAALSGGKVESNNFVLGGLQICGQTFERKPARSINSEDLNLSKRASGAVCAKILSGCRFVIDYPRKRVGLKIIPKTFGDQIRGIFDLLYGDIMK